MFSLLGETKISSGREILDFITDLGGNCRKLFYVGGFPSEEWNTLYNYLQSSKPLKAS